MIGLNFNLLAKLHISESFSAVSGCFVPIKKPIKENTASTENMYQEADLDPFNTSSCQWTEVLNKSLISISR